MATTKIWPVYDSVKRVLDYARNPEKTEYQDLREVLHYAQDGKKTELFEESVQLVSALNCEGDPYEDMTRVREQFGDRGTILAFHGYQSFKPGEVTPEECHRLGVELAAKLWGEDHQVVVATHLNCNHLHNHFVINPISFRTGKKLDSGYSLYKSMRAASDELCREHDLSVIQAKDNRTPRNLYFAEKRNEGTKNNQMKWAISQALSLSKTWEDFELNLRDLGYEIDRNEGGKYPKMKSLNAQKWTRLYHLGEEYNLDVLDLGISRNAQGYNGEIPDYREELYWTKYDNYWKPLPRQHWLKERDIPYGPLTTVVLLIVYLCGGPDLLTPDKPAPKYYAISPEMREASRRLERYCREGKMLAANGIDTKEDADEFLMKQESELIGLEQERTALYNRLRRCKDPEEEEYLKDKVHALSARMKPLRQSIADMKDVLERSGVMLDMIEAEEQLRRAQILREYTLPPSERQELDRLTGQAVRPDPRQSRDVRVRKQGDAR